MNKLLLLTTATLIATSSYAFEVKPYIEGKISQNWMQAKYEHTSFKDQIFGGQVEVGAKLSQFRVGLEGYYNNTAEDKTPEHFPVKMESQGFFLNGYWDIPLGEPKNIKPFIGAGIGYSWLEGREDFSPNPLGKISFKDKDFGWNIALGVGYTLNDNLDLTLGYRYEDLGSIKKYSTKTDFTNHKLSLGVRYTF